MPRKRGLNYTPEAEDYSFDDTAIGEAARESFHLIVWPRDTHIMIGWLPVVDFNTGARVSEGVSENGPRPWRAADWWFMMTASAMREDVMIRLSGRKRLAVLLVAVVSALSLACAQDAAEPTSTDMSNAGAPMAAAAASPPAAREAPSAVPREPVATVNLDEIKEQAVRDLFDDQGRMVNPDQRLARIAVRYLGSTPVGGRIVR